MRRIPTVIGMWQANGVWAAAQASELPSGTARPVDFDAARGWHRVNLDGIVPVVPPGGREKQNDAIERVKLMLSSRSDGEQTARLLFEKINAALKGTTP